MTWQTWLVFSTASLILLALPRRCMIDVATFALGHGRGSAFATVTGVVLGHLVAAALVLTISMGIARVSPLALSLVQGAGLGLLVLKSIGFWHLPSATQPMADNDNLPVEKPFQIVAHLVRRTAIQADTVTLVAAFLPQFALIALASPERAIALPVAFAGISGVVAVAYALAAAKVRIILQKHRRRRAKDHSRGTVLIAARSVTAGYRKIAA